MEEENQIPSQDPPAATPSSGRAYIDPSKIRRVEPITSETNLGIPGFEPLNKYDQGLTRNKNQAALREQNQTGWQAFGNSLAQAASELTLGTLEGIGYALDVEQIFNEFKGTNTEYSNWFSDIMKTGKEAVQEATPIYGGSATFDPLNARWWMANASSVVTGLSMAFGAGAVIKGVSGVGRLTGASKLLSKTAPGTQLGTKILSNAVLSRHIENTMEASGAYESTYQKLKEQGVDEERAKASAADAASNVYRTGYVNLITDIPQYAVFFGARSPRLAAIKRKARMDQAKKSIGRRALDVGGIAASEGFEEVFQLGIQRASEDGSRGVLNTVAEALGEVFKDEEGEEAQEFWASFALGAAGGGLFGLGSLKGAKPRNYEEEAMVRSLQRLANTNQAERENNPIRAEKERRRQAIDNLGNPNAEETNADVAAALQESTDPAEKKRGEEIEALTAAYEQEIQTQVAAGKTETEAREIAKSKALAANSALAVAQYNGEVNTSVSEMYGELAEKTTGSKELVLPNKVRNEEGEEIEVFPDNPNDIVVNSIIHERLDEKVAANELLQEEADALKTEFPIEQGFTINPEVPNTNSYEVLKENANRLVDEVVEKKQLEKEVTNIEEGGQEYIDQQQAEREKAEKKETLKSTIKALDPNPIQLAALAGQDPELYQEVLAELKNEVEEEPEPTTFASQEQAQEYYENNPVTFLSKLPEGRIMSPEAFTSTENFKNEYIEDENSQEFAEASMPTTPEDVEPTTSTQEEMEDSGPPPEVQEETETEAPVTNTAVEEVEETAEEPSQEEAESIGALVEELENETDADTTGSLPTPDGIVKTFTPYVVEWYVPLGSNIIRFKYGYTEFAIPFATADINNSKKLTLPNGATVILRGFNNKRPEPGSRGLLLNEQGGLIFSDYQDTKQIDKNRELYAKVQGKAVELRVPDNAYNRSIQGTDKSIHIDVYYEGEYIATLPYRKNMPASYLNFFEKVKQGNYLGKTLPVKPKVVGVWAQQILDQRTTNDVTAFSNDPEIVFVDETGKQWGRQTEASETLDSEKVATNATYLVVKDDLGRERFIPFQRKKAKDTPGLIDKMYDLLVNNQTQEGNRLFGEILRLTEKVGTRFIKVPDYNEGITKFGRPLLNQDGTWADYTRLKEDSAKSTTVLVQPGYLVENKEAGEVYKVRELSRENGLPVSLEVDVLTPTLKPTGETRTITDFDGLNAHYASVYVDYYKLRQKPLHVDKNNLGKGNWNKVYSERLETTTVPETTFAPPTLELDFSDMEEVEGGEPVAKAAEELAPNLPDTSEVTKEVSKKWLDKVKKRQGKTRKLRKAYAPNNGRTWNKQEALAWLKKNLPQIPVHVLETIDNLSDEPSWGLFKDAAIWIANNAPEGTLYHEAFHAVFHTSLTDAQRESLLKEAKKRYGKNIRTDLPIEEALEEALAEEFADYIRGVKPKSLPARIKSFFTNLWNDIQYFLGNELTIDTFFDRINRGKFKERGTLRGRFAARYSRKVGFAKALGVSTNELRSVIDSFSALLADTINTHKEKGGDINDVFSEDPKKSLILSEELDYSLINKLYDHFGNTQFTAEQIDKVSEIFNGVIAQREDGSVVPGFLYKDVLDNLGRFGFTLKENLEDVENTSTRDSWGETQFQVDRFASLSTQLKTLFNKIPRLNNDFKYIENAIGLPEYYNSGYVYVRLQELLEGSVDGDDMMRKLRKSNDAIARQVLRFINKDENLKGEMFQAIGQNHKFNFISVVHIDKEGQEDAPEKLTPISTNATTHTNSVATLLTELMLSNRNTINTDYTASADNLPEILSNLGIDLNNVQLSNLGNLKTLLNLLNSNKFKGFLDKVSKDRNEYQKNSGIITDLAKELRTAFPNTIQSSHRKPDGNNVYEFSIPNFLATTLNKLKSNFYRKDLVDFYRSDGIYQILPFLKKITGDRQYKSIDPSKLQFELLSDVKLRGKDQGTEYSKLDRRTLVKAILAAYGGSKGYIRIPFSPFSDSGNFGFLKIPMDRLSINLTDRMVNGVVTEMGELINNAKAEIVRHLQGDLNGIRRTTDFHYYPKLKDSAALALAKELYAQAESEGVNMTPDELVTFKISKLANPRLNKLLERIVRDQISENLNEQERKLREINVLQTETRRRKIDNEWVESQVDILEGVDTGTASAREYLAQMTAMNMLYQQQMQQLFTGDISFYKDAGDFYKRNKEIMSPGLRSDLTASWQGETAPPKYNVVTMADVKSSANNSAILKALQALDPRNADRRAKQFENSDETDAGSYTDLITYRFQQISHQRWSDQQEEAFRRILSGDFVTRDTNVIFNTRKPFYYSLHKEVINGVTYIIPIQNKDSEHILIPHPAYLNENSATYNPMFKQMLEQMGYVIENGKITNNIDLLIKKRKNPANGLVDKFTVGSAIKVGARDVFDTSRLGLSEDQLAVEEQTISDEDFEEIPEIKVLNSLKGIRINTSYAKQESGLKIGTDKDINPFWVSNKSNHTVQSLAEDIANEHGYDEQDVRNIIIELIQYSPKAYREQLRDSFTRTLREEPASLADAVRREFNSEDWLVQVETPTHHIDDTVRHSYQHLQHMLSNIDKNKTYKINGKEYDYKAVKQLIHDWVINDMNKELAKINLEFKSVEQFVERLRKEIIDRGLGTHLLEALEEVEHEWGRTKLPLWHPLIAYRLQAITNSIYTNNVFTRKLNGGVSLVNLSSFGFKRKPKIVFREDGSIDHFEAFAPIHTKALLKYQKEDGTIDTKDVIKGGDGHLLEGMVWRTPTEDKYSIIKVKIVGFLPTETGAGIVLPPEITKIAGLDFDIDKLFGFFYTNKGMKLPEDVDPMADYHDDSIRDRALLDIFREVYSTPSVANAVLNPGGYGQITAFNTKHSVPSRKDLAREGISVKGGKIVENINTLLFTAVAEIAERMNVGKALIGVAANAVSAHNLMQDTDIRFAEAITVDGKSYAELGRRINENDESIIRNIAEFLAAFVDNGKDPQSYYANINSYTIDVALSMAMTGVPIDSILAFLNQPDIRAYVQEIMLNGNNYQAKKKADEKYGMHPKLKMLALDTEKLINRIGKESEINRNMIHTFNKIKANANDLTKVVLGLKTHSNGVGPDINASEVLIQRIKDMRSVDTIENLIKFLDDPNRFHNHGNTLLQEVHRDVTKRLDVEHVTSKFFDGIMSMMKDNKASGMLTQKEVKTINEHIMDFLFSLVEPTNVERITKLYTGEGNVFKKWAQLKESGKYIALLSRLNKVVDRQVVNGKIRETSVLVFNGGVKNTEINQQIRDDWAEMLLSSDPEERQFAKDLADYAMMQSGFRISPYGFSEFIPPNYFASKEWIDKLDRVEEALEMIKSSNQKQLEMIFFDQFIRNNYKSLNLPTPAKDKIISEGDGFIELKLPEPTETVFDYIVKSNEVYRLVGNNESQALMYRRTQTLGLNIPTYGQVATEYDATSPLKTSIFSVNRKVDAIHFDMSTIGDVAQENYTLLLSLIEKDQIQKEGC